VDPSCALQACFDCMPMPNTIILKAVLEKAAPDSG
jgi:hypothetical protein